MSLINYFYNNVTEVTECNTYLSSSSPTILTWIVLSLFTLAITFIVYYGIKCTIGGHSPV